MKSDVCPVCQGSAYLDQRAHYDLALDQSPKNYQIMRCTGCGLRWMTPYPTPADYQAIYDHDYYAALREGGLSYPEEKQELLTCYSGIANRFSSFGVMNGLLDVGCGTGEFLAAARACGIQGDGVEPSAYAAEKAAEKGFHIFNGVLVDLLPVSEPYSAVHCSHVLEHVPDAGRFMDELKSVMSPDAPLYLEVPRQFDGILDVMHRIRGYRRGYSDYSIHHHYFFTPEAIKLLLGAHGFEILSITTYLPCRRAMRKPSVRILALQSALWLADRLAGRGDVISVWARRRA